MRTFVGPSPAISTPASTTVPARASSTFIEQCLKGTRSDDWKGIAQGSWSESPYHSGFVSYCIQRSTDGHWIVQQVERNAELDGVTDEDVEAGALNDDQIQALRGMTLEEAQSRTFETVLAIWPGAPSDATVEEAIDLLWGVLTDAGLVGNFG